jgi:hypothetical protein
MEFSVLGIGLRAPRSKSMIVRSPTNDADARSARDQFSMARAPRHWAGVMIVFVLMLQKIC